MRFFKSDPFRIGLLCLFCTSVAALCVGCASAPQSEGPVDAPEILQGSDGDLVVVVFSSVDCPVGNAMAPQLGRTLDHAREHDVRTYLVYPRASTTDAEIARHREDYRLAAVPVRDSSRQIVTLLDARITPEAFLLVLDGTGGWRIAYRGRINDLYASIGNRRDTPSRLDLQIAIDETRVGGWPVVTETEAVGCLIER